jgi:hypothetical protein
VTQARTPEVDVRSLALIWRRIGLGGNPLCRPVDRLEGWCTLALAMLALVAAPLVAWQVSMAMSAQHAEVRPVPAEAVLTSDAPAVTAGAAVAWVPRVQAPAAWTAPDGSRRTGDVVVGAGTPAGTRVAVELDTRGRLIQPGSRTDPAAVGCAAGLACAAGLGCAWLVLRLVTDRHRMARWQRGWRRVEPRWRTAT